MLPQPRRWAPTAQEGTLAKEKQWTRCVEEPSITNHQPAPLLPPLPRRAAGNPSTRSGFQVEASPGFPLRIVHQVRSLWDNEEGDAGQSEDRGGPNPSSTLP